MYRVMIAILLALAVNSWAEPLEKPGVTYEKKPSGRTYGSDGTVYDKLPTGKVYDSHGKAYNSNTKQGSIGNATTLPKPLPRANTTGGRATGTRTMPRR